MKRRYGHLARACLAVALWAATPAQAAFDDPLTVFSPGGVNSTPAAGLGGPCGLAVDSSGGLYVSTYYTRSVYVYSSTLTFKSQLGSIPTLTGPCGLAVDTSNRLYVSNFHSGVVRYGASPIFGAGTSIDSAHSTGVAADPTTGTVYVNGRTHIAIYNSAGALTGEVGAGSLVDAYGVAVSRFPATTGRLYVPDAGTDTVKVFDPLVSTITPVTTLTGPPGGFNSLLDSAIAVDSITGEVYVVDQVGSRLSERPESIVDVFDAAGTYKGHLKYRVIDGAPAGIAVDNSVGANQGRVYVTSGNGEKASVYVYPPGAATFATGLPAPGSLVAANTETTAAKAALQAAAAESPPEVLTTTAPTPGTAEQSGARAPQRAKHRHHAKHRRHHAKHRRHHAKRRSRR